MKFGAKCVAGAAILTICGCNSLDFDLFKEKPKEQPVPERSPYSILAEGRSGARVIDPGSAEKDEVNMPDRADEPSKALPDVPEDEIPTLKTDTGPKDVDALYKKLFPDRSEEDAEPIKVAIEYDAANIADVVPSFARPLKLNYLLDPGVTGTITMSLKAEMKPREVWTLFEQILQMAGAYCEMENQVIHIRPLEKLPQEKKMFQPDSNIEARLIPLKYVSARELTPQLKPFLSDTATATALERQNVVMLVENTANMERLVILVEQLDRRSKAGWRRAVFICRNIPAAQIQQELLDILPVLGFPVADGKQGNENGEISIVCLDRVQAIVASAVTDEPLKEVRKWIATLDKTDIGEQERVYLYDVINGKADELMNALAVIFPVEATTMTADSSGSSSTSTTSSAGAGGKAGASGSPGRAGASVRPGAAAAGNTAKGNSIYDTPVKVFADAVHNRLLLRTTPKTYAMIRAILDRLDTIPTQILMQILVVEIELSNSNEFGMEFSMSGGSGSSQSIFGTNFESLAPNTSGKNPQSGGTFTIFNPRNPDQKFGYIRALASNSKLRVLSSPQIIAKSNSEAKISVGKRVPVITNEITDTQSSIDPNNTSLRRNYQYEDTGIILTVTPQVTKGGMISMALEQTISDAIENTMKGIESPIIKEDILKTELAIRDGRTLIMGGLIKEKQNEMISSLPWVIDIPFLRAFLSDTTKTSERTEILVLITATIIREDNKLEEMVRRYNEAVMEIDKFEYRQYRNAMEKDKERKAAAEKLAGE